MSEKTKRACAGIAAAAITATLIGLWACTSESTHPAGIGSYAGSGSTGSAAGALTTEAEPGSADGSASASTEGSATQANQVSADETSAQETSATTGKATSQAKGNAAPSTSPSVSQTNKPASTPKGESNTTGETSSQPSRTWVEEQGHWEPTYEDVWVEDTSAWDEYVVDYSYYAFSDGFNTASDAEALAHQKATGASYSVKDHYTTTHHDATGHWESRQTDQRWVVDVPAHWE